MAGEIKQVTDIKCNIDGKKGLYSGSAISTTFGAKPDGYGKANLKNGTILEGRFKNGSFVSGKAILGGTIYTGEFDSFKWLNGTITYPNGSYLKGEKDKRTGNIIIHECKNIQQFGDEFVGKHVDENGTKKLIGTLTTQDGSTFTGEFDCKNNSSLDAFNVPSNTIFYCVKGKANLNIANTTQFTANLKGDYELEKDKGIIRGIYTYKDAKYSQKMNGKFTVFREKATSNTPFAYFSEDFYDTLKATSNKDYLFNITSHIGTKIEYEDTNSTFFGEIIEPTQNNYFKGKLSTKDGKFAFDGTLDKHLNVQKGEIVLAQSPSFNNIVSFIGSIDATNPQITAKGYLTLTDGYQEGEFKVSTLTKNITFPLKDNFIFKSGKFKTVTKNGATFEGKTLTQNDNDAKFYQLFKNNPEKCKEYYLGMMTKTNSKGQQILYKHGLFSTQFEHLEGSIREGIKVNNEEAYFEGNKTRLTNNDSYKYVGKVTFKNGDYYEGSLTPKFTLETGKLRLTFENKSIFEGEKKGFGKYEGKLERKGDFWQQGEFKLDKDENFIFVKGRTKVNFAGNDEFYCLADFDEEGFPLFEFKKYLCNFKNNPSGETILAIVADNITDAVTEFERIRKLENPINTGKEEFTRSEVQTAIDLAVAEALAQQKEKYEAELAKANDIINHYKNQEKQLIKGFEHLSKSLNEANTKLENKRKSKQPQQQK